MKILFGMSSPEYLRFYDQTIVELADRGHDVAVAVNAVRGGKPVRLDRLEWQHARVSVVGLIPARGDGWEALARAVRGTQDFIRYWHPKLSSASRLRERVKQQVLPWPLQWLDRIATLSPRAVARVLGCCEAVERAIPVAPAVARFLEEHAPDLVLVSPLVEPASDQVDLVRAAQARGTCVGALVASWDNLTNKGDLRVATDFVAVWNEAQKQEAVQLHRVAPDAVVVTGAQVFDRWFERTPSSTRDEFCRQVGLSSARPFVLYTGSSIFIARADAEMPFVRRWIEALRASTDPTVRDLAVLVRPHPYNGQAWRPETLADLADVTVWPRGGFDPVDEANRAGLFDSLYHGAAVVGINTSAMIEAAIVGRPVLSIEAPEFAGTQDGTLHYRHLLPENGGFLRVAADFDEHVRQLRDVLASPESTQAELSRFVGRFVRPHGLARAATPILADAIEQRGQRPGRGVAPDVGGALGRVLVRVFVLWPLARVAPFAPSPSEWRRTRRDRKRAAAAEAAQSQARRTARPSVSRQRALPPRRSVWTRLVAATRSSIVAARKRVTHAARLMRYRGGLLARRLSRLRGAPTE